MYDYWRDERKFKQRLEDVYRDAGAYNVQCGTKAVMAAGVMTSSFNFTYKSVIKNLYDLSSSDAHRIRENLVEINRSIKREEDAFPYIERIGTIFAEHSENSICQGFYCQRDIEFHSGIIPEERETYQKARSSGVPMLVGLSPENYHYVVLIKNPCTSTEWIINPRQRYGRGGVYKLSSSGESIGTRYGIFRYKSTKTLVPFGRYWYLPPGEIDYECCLIQDTKALRAKLSLTTSSERGIIGVYSSSGFDFADREKAPNSGRVWPQKDSNGESTGYYECWLNRLIPTKAIYLKMQHKEGKWNLIGVFETKYAAETEAEMGTSAWEKERV
jgi:hypothetical protein